MMELRLATRSSALALYQANRVAELIGGKYPDIKVRLVHITTSGDRLQTRPLREFGDKGLFVKEIEEAITRGEADAGVHSLKDVPGELPQGFELPAFPERADPRDALLTHSGRTLSQLPLGAVLGTSSLRRQGQILRIRPDLQILPVRGNVDTRVRKLRNGEFGALILAAAGLHRLGMHAEISEVLSVEEMIPAPGQGIIAVEAPANSPFANVWSELNDPGCETAGLAEREFSRRVGADCRTPAACHCRFEGDRAQILAMVCSPDGRQCITTEQGGSASSAVELAGAAARDVLAQGAEAIIAAARGTQ
jgi:hydroxymethylbilane synthase